MDINVWRNVKPPLLQFDLSTIVEEYPKSYEDIEFEQWKKEQEEMENNDASTTE